MKGVVLSLIVIFLCAVAPAAGQQCNAETKCANRACCSSFGWCGISAPWCSKDQGCQSYCWTADGGANNVIAKPKNYNPAGVNWNLTAANVACAAVDGNKPLEWRSKFNWTAFCGPIGPQGKAACGKCLRVHNSKYADFVYTTVRVVDICDGKKEAFLLDTPVFDELDIDRKGHLQVDYHFIDCEDDKDALFSII